MSIIELVDNEESFINPRDLIVEKKQPKKEKKRVWLSYITPYMRINAGHTPQVEQEIDAFFNRLCDFIDVELKKKHKNIKHVRSEYYYYRESLFDEIYRLAKNLVCSFYGQESKESADFISYMMESMLSSDIRFLLIKEMDEYRGGLPFPNAETREQFRLTSYGTKIIWWDPSGKLRDEQVFDSTEMSYFNKLMKRPTKFTEVPALMTLCLEKYTDLLHIVLEDLKDETIRWKVKPNNYFRNYFQLPLEDSRVWLETNHLSADLYLFAENSIRKEIEGFRLSAASESQQSLQKYLPNESIQKIEEYLNQKTTLKFDYPTITSLRTVYKTAWNEAANFIIEQSVEKVCELLEEIARDPDLKKIAIKVIKNSTDPDKNRVFIFLMEKRAFPLSKEMQKQRNSFIHSTRQEDYQALLAAQDLVYKKLPIILKELNQPARRKIKLDNELITASNSALYTIIDMVDDYLGEEAIDPDIALKILVHKDLSLAEEQTKPDNTVLVSTLEETNESEIAQTVEQMEFITNLVLNNGMSLEEFKKKAADKGKLYQAYLNELNDVLYDVFEDQVLTIYQQQVIIEEDFIEEMREWIDG
ncbi:TerB-C domain-containing protein [Carnobacterium alterfunditum]|uniref:TerB-C domain-containing protein n=1 Tax=Carnobacterium alterfunditum TaxID=28230 RepID=A0A1N6EN82_9LACT|nr:tellurite resistance TerB C-terminal domain-containing protein [Carnobacterium alterfunditum]SIN84437.1 TerB-C domain-containing protein [Carnobacterium alterfunditum]